MFVLDRHLYGVCPFYLDRRNMVKPCASCGTLYDACVSCLNKEFFYWKSKFCSVECFQQYVALVEEGRRKESELKGTSI